MQFIPKGYDFDDVMMVPRFSNVISRTEPDITTIVGGISYNHGFIAANLDCIATLPMRSVQQLTGGMFIHNRFIPPSSLLPDDWATIGIKGINTKEWDEQVDKVLERTQNIVIDVAHAHSKIVQDTVPLLKKRNDKIRIIVGNIATKEAARDLCNLGVNGIKIGLGGGAACLTRMVCGIGIPAISCIQECVEVGDSFGVSMIYDGGVNRYDKACKAIALGCSAVMMGKVFADTKEADLPIIEGKSYYWGQSSLECREKWYHESVGIIPEGSMVCIENPKSTNSIDIIYNYSSALKTSMSYLGAKTINEYQSKCSLISTSNIKPE